MLTAEDIDQTKARLLSWNPPPPLPVIKRGLVPNLILGGIGQRAVYQYRGWDILVIKVHGGQWSASMTRPPPNHDSSYITASTFDGAVCAAKIIVDYAATRDSFPTSEERLSFRRMWSEIAEFTDGVLALGKPPTRANVARAMETSRIVARRSGSPQQYKTAYTWWDALPLHERLQLIDDRLELMYCRYGPDPKDWR